jgi:hypothetical protein
MFGAVGVCMALKHSNFVAMHHRRKRFEGHKHPHPPQKYILKLGGLSPIHLMCRRRAQGLVWGARGAFLLVVAMVVVVVMASEKQNKNAKISCLSPKSLFMTFIVNIL